MQLFQNLGLSIVALAFVIAPVLTSKSSAKYATPGRAEKRFVLLLCMNGKVTSN